MKLLKMGMARLIFKRNIVSFIYLALIN